MSQAKKESRGCNGAVRVPPRTAPHWPPTGMSGQPSPPAAESDPVTDVSHPAVPPALEAAAPLAELGAPPPSPPPDWPALATQRWGPGLEDDTPGIVVDRPDRERMMAALETAELDPDAY